MSFESFGTFEKTKNDSYKLINTYTGKYLTKNLFYSTNSTDEPAELYINLQIQNILNNKLVIKLNNKHI